MDSKPLLQKLLIEIHKSILPPKYKDIQEGLLFIGQVIKEAEISKALK